MRANRCGARHIQPSLITKLPRFGVQVVDNFHVIRNEANRGDHDIRSAGVSQGFQVIKNVGTKPWLNRWTAPALINKPP